MSDITHMGLPQGLPEMTPTQVNDAARQMWTHGWNPPPKRTPPPAREMTAADLGLSLQQWDPEWLTDMYGVCPWRVWKPLLDTNAPYSFWLGADHG
jgi:hypothetical protein